MLLENIEREVLSIDESLTNYTFQYQVTNDLPGIDNMITLSEYGGQSLGDFTNAGSRYVQLVLKHTSADQGYKDIWMIYKYFIKKYIYESEGFWMKCVVKNVPIALGEDSKGRMRYVINLGIFTNCEEGI